jgi:hypothetical protein
MRRLESEPAVKPALPTAALETGHCSLLVAAIN